KPEATTRGRDFDPISASCRLICSPSKGRLNASVTARKPKLLSSPATSSTFVTSYTSPRVPRGQAARPHCGACLMTTRSAARFRSTPADVLDLVVVELIERNGAARFRLRTGGLSGDCARYEVGHDNSGAC